jgi:hypothetical protein
MLAIVLAGWQARGIPEQGVPLRVDTAVTPGQVNDPVRWRLLMGHVCFALFWLPQRFFIGRAWFSAGARKLGDPEWMNGGAARLLGARRGCARERPPAHHL